MFTWSFSKYSPLVECTSYSVAAIPRTHDASHSLSGPWESPHFSWALLQRSQIKCPRALSLVMGIRRSHREQDWGCKAVTLNLAKNCMMWIHDVRLCVVMMKSPYSPMKLWLFLCNVLLQFTQHWRVVHCCTLASPPFCAMWKRSVVDNVKQYYQPTGR